LYASPLGVTRERRNVLQESRFSDGVNAESLAHELLCRTYCRIRWISSVLTAIAGPDGLAGGMK
jgi:hypothetical protein